MAEKEYIERKAALILCQDFIDSHEDGSWRWVNAITDKDIMNIPAADVVEVVRCKDCKHAAFYKCKNDPCYNRIICEYQIGTGDENFYCSFGERKEIDNEQN